KATDNAATISNLIGQEINVEYEDENTITNYKGLYMRLVTDTDLPANSWGIHLYNQQKAEADGGTITSAIYVSDNLNPALDAWEYGLDLSGSAAGINTADIRLQHGETIKNTTDGRIDVDAQMLFQNSTDSVTGYMFKDSNGGTSVLNIDTTNERVGIGTDAPGNTLDVRGATLTSNGTYGTTLTYSAGNATGILDTYGNHGLEIRTNNIEVARITSGQLVGFGTATPDTIVEVVEESADAVLTVTVYDDDATELPEVNLRKADNTEASPALVDDGDVVGEFSFAGHDGSGFHKSAIMRGIIDGVPSDGTDMPTGISWLTTPDGSATPVEGLYLSPDGELSGDPFNNNETDKMTGAVWAYQPTLTALWAIGRNPATTEPDVT
ncbi:unnamed protein product, partial [marine sediment metagenome]